MTWARKRQLIIAGVMLLILLILGVSAWFLFFRVPPSCIDNKQNGDEQGVDCGGSCTYLCAASLVNPEPIVKFVRAVSPNPGRTDIIAYIDNPNSTAGASQVHYTLDVYDDQNVILGKREGYVDVPPTVTTPLYIPSVVLGSSAVARAFLTIDSASVHWTPAVAPEKKTAVENVIIQEGDAPRVTATIRNTTVLPLPQSSFVVTLFDAQGNAIAASATLVQSIAPKDSAQVVFTWPSPFSASVSRVEILPVVSLSAQ